MTTPNKRKDTMADDRTLKRIKKECSYGEGCYRKNPAHFREFSHSHLESIIDSKQDGQYTIPPRLSMQRHMILEQIEIIMEKQLYTPASKTQPKPEDSKNQNPSIDPNKDQSNSESNKGDNTSFEMNIKDTNQDHTKEQTKVGIEKKGINPNTATEKASSSKENAAENRSETNSTESKTPMSKKPDAVYSSAKVKDSDYRPLAPPSRRIEDFFKVVAPRGKMAAKHAAQAPYYLFYTTITDAKETHNQPYSITFQEILDPSLGELKCSLQINFMVELGWLLAHYYFAGYSNKKLTILYGDEGPELKTIGQKKPHVEACHVKMASPFGTHHTKMMILCYEDGSLRVVISTANLYLDDWENRTQGLWFSPSCPELPPDAMSHEGESPTLFKRCLLKYLNHYHLPQLAFYIERVKRCDFSHINVFLVASVPGGHFDMDWGLTRVGSLLRQHCEVPAAESRLWSLVAQASSLGSYGDKPQLWLTGDFLHHFTRVKNHPPTLSQPPPLRLIYPSLENVRQSHDDLLGGGCLPYSAAVNSKQPWLVDFLHQWKATSSGRNKAMPHIKSYTRTSPCNKMAAYYLLTSGNVSKAAWGSINKGNAALRIMSYEAGVMFLPRFVINKEFFPLDKNDKDRLVIPYDTPPTRYTSDMSPWVSDYLM